MYGKAIPIFKFPSLLYKSNTNHRQNCSLSLTAWSNEQQSAPYRWIISIPVSIEIKHPCCLTNVNLNKREDNVNVYFNTTLDWHFLSGSKELKRYLFIKNRPLMCTNADKTAQVYHD